MSLLRSLFSFRDKSQSHGQGDIEKPFLDHLEDLRGTLMKMGFTLVLSMIIAFCFKNQLTELLEKPLDAVDVFAERAEVVRAQTERSKLLEEMSSLAVSASARMLEKTEKALTPEDKKHLAETILAEHQADLAREAAASQQVAETKPKKTRLQTLSVPEAFTIALKLAFFAGIGVSFPFQLYYVISFVLPALTRKERRLLGPGIAGGTVLFLAGLVIAYKWILPKTLVWFHDFGASMGFASNWKAGDYFSFVTQLCLACGFLCELPLVMIVLSVMNIISFSLLKSSRRYAIAIILVIVAIIAPTPDPITFFTLAIPMLAIFEGSIWLVWLIERNRRKKELSGQTLGD